MLNLISSAFKVSLALDRCDMRKSFNSLNTLAVEQLQAAPSRDALFVLINKATTLPLPMRWTKR